jgi:DNA-binding XRE family transcriptional regulator
MEALNGMAMSNALVWNETLKSRLRQAREHNGISQAKAAECIGVESNTL